MEPTAGSISRSTGRASRCCSARSPTTPARRTSVATSTATLTGTVDPSYRETAAYFEYGRSTDYGSKTPVRVVGSGNGQVPFAEPLTGLRQGVTYHYRLVATNAEGTTTGAD